MFVLVLKNRFNKQVLPIGIIRVIFKRILAVDSVSVLAPG